MRTLWSLSLCALLLTPAIAVADGAQKKCSDSADQAGGADGKQKTKYEVVIGPDGKKIFRIKGGFILCGKVPRPDVLYGLLNSTINYEWESLKQDFLPKVIRSVEHPPF